MRALVVSHAYPRRSNAWHGGFVHRLNLGLRDCGVDVHVLQLADWSPPWPVAAIDANWREAWTRRRDLRDECDGIPIHHPLVFTPRPHRLFPRDSWECQTSALIEFCRRDRRLTSADVVVGHFMVPDGYHALRLGEALHVPVVGVAWGDDVHAWPERLPGWREHLEAVLTRIDVPVACARRIADDGNAWLSQARDDWRVIYAGVDLDRHQPVADRSAARQRAMPMLSQDVAARGKILLMLAQRVVAKGYLDLLDAWQRTHQDAPDWHLVMGGSDQGDIDVEAEIRSRGLEARAHWIGPVSDVALMLQASDAFALPSHNEGLSLSVIEAMATGLPVIATNVGGHAEIIGDPLEGWLVEPRNVDQLSSALLEVCSLSASERARRAVAARRAAARVGTPRENAERFARMLEEVVQAARAAGSARRHLAASHAIEMDA